MIGQGLTLFAVIAYLVLTLSVCGRGDRGGVSWFDLPMVPVGRAQRRAGSRSGNRARHRRKR